MTTNRDWLNSLSNEEFGKVADNSCNLCIFNCTYYCDIDDDNVMDRCDIGIAEWLRQERVDEEDFDVPFTVEGRGTNEVGANNG